MVQPILHDAQPEEDRHEPSRQYQSLGFPTQNPDTAFGPQTGGRLSFRGNRDRGTAPRARRNEVARADQLLPGIKPRWTLSGTRNGTLRQGRPGRYDQAW